MHLTLSNDDLAKINQAARIIGQQLKEHHTVPALAEQVLLNRNKLQIGFRQVFGIGPYAYLMKKRIEKAQELLLEQVPTRRIALALGFSGAQAENNFIRFFKKAVGQTPTAWRKEQQNQGDALQEYVA